MKSILGPGHASHDSNLILPNLACRVLFHRRRQFGDWSDEEDSDAEGSLPQDCGQQKSKAPEQSQGPQPQVEQQQP